MDVEEQLDREGEKEMEGEQQLDRGVRKGRK